MANIKASSDPKTTGTAATGTAAGGAGGAATGTAEKAAEPGKKSK